MIRFLFRFFSFPFPFYLLYDKSRPKKGNHQTLIRINREISFPSSFLSKLFLSQNIGFSSGFSCQAKIMFVRAILRMLWFIRLCHDSDSFAICTETVFKLFRFFLSALPIVFKADQLFSSAIPVSLKFSSLLLRFFRKFFTLSISFPMNEEIFSEVEFSFSTNPSAPLYQEYLFHVWAFCLFKICTCSFRKFLLLDFSLFNCDGWSVDRKEPFIQKRCTLYLPIILIGGPICRHMLLFYVKLCHRTHPFHF